MSIISALNVEKNVTTPSTTIDILKGVSLNVNQGEAVAILGASGSGKTTLLSLLAGLDVPTRGEIILDGFSLNKMNEDERAELRLSSVGFVFQNFELLPNLNALENVMIPLELRQFSNPREIATELLFQIGLENRLKHFPRQLSGGEQQRVAIARACVTKPKVLFADEPTGCLDSKTAEKIIELLFSLKNKMGSSLIFVTHDQDLAKRCDRTLLLKQGKVL